LLTVDSDSPIDSSIPEPFECPSIYQWIETCLTTQSKTTFLTLPELIATRSSEQIKNAFELDHWIRLTPRTLLFAQFFALMQPGWSPAQFVEALAAAGMDRLLLETLPEAVLAPLQEALVQCQTEPPTMWSKDLLAIIGREDVNILLTPGQRPRQAQSSLLVSHFCYL
jgi:anaphase-promoting complex subunit 1